MTFGKSHLVDVAAQVLSATVGRACYLLLQILLARSLGPADFGIYALSWTIAGFLGAIAPMGMPQAVIRFGYRGRSLLTSAPVLITGAGGLLCSVGMVVVADWLTASAFGDPRTAQVIIILAPSVCLLCFFNICSAGLRSAGQNVSSAIVGALLFVLYLGFSSLLFVNRHYLTPSGAAMTYSAALLTITVPTALLCYRENSEVPAVSVRPLLGFGVVTMVIHSASVFNLFADRLVVGFLRGASDVGLYQVASQLAMIALVLRVAVLGVFEARVPKGDPMSSSGPDVTRDFVAATRLFLHICAPGLLCLALTSRFWTVWLFGPAFSAASTSLAVLALGQLVLSFAGPSLTALHMTGEERSAMRITVASCLINLVGNFAFIPLMGLVGSALATSLAAVTLASASAVRLARRKQLRYRATCVSDIFFALVVCSAIDIPVALSGLSTLTAALVLLVSNYAVYLLTVGLLRRVEDEAFDMFGAAARALADRIGRKEAAR